MVGRQRPAYVAPAPVRVGLQFVDGTHLRVDESSVLARDLHRLADQLRSGEAPR